MRERREISFENILKCLNSDAIKKGNILVPDLIEDSLSSWEALKCLPLKNFPASSSELF